MKKIFKIFVVIGIILLNIVLLGSPYMNSLDSGEDSLY